MNAAMFTQHGTINESYQTSFPATIEHTRFYWYTLADLLGNSSGHKAVIHKNV